MLSFYTIGISIEAYKKIEFVSLNLFEGGGVEIRDFVRAYFLNNVP
jgi:hypothetical protein